MRRRATRSLGCAARTGAGHDGADRAQAGAELAGGLGRGGLREGSSRHAALFIDVHAAEAGHHPQAGARLLPDGAELLAGAASAAGSRLNGAGKPKTLEKETHIYNYNANITCRGEKNSSTVTSSVSTTASRKFLSVTCKPELADDAGTAASSKDKNKTTRRAIWCASSTKTRMHAKAESGYLEGFVRHSPSHHSLTLLSQFAAFRFLLDLTPSVERSFSNLALQWRLCCGHSLCQRHSPPARCGQRPLQSVRPSCTIVARACSVVRLMTSRESLLREGFDVSPPLLPLQAWRCRFVVAERAQHSLLAR